MTIESIHIIYKNLIKIGKELNVEEFRKYFLEKGFVQKERVIPTPQGPLKEFLLLDPSNMRDLVVCSVKGFVVDAKETENTKRLMNLAYEIFESLYGDLFTSLVYDIQVLVQTLIYMKDGATILNKMINLRTLKTLSDLTGSRNVRPGPVGFSWGTINGPSGFTNITFNPLRSVDSNPIRDRISLNIEHFDRDPDRGVEFVDNLEKMLKKILKGLYIMK